MAKNDWTENTGGGDGAINPVLNGVAGSKLFYTVIDARSADSLTLPDEVILANSRFFRENNDLRITTEAGDEVLITDYFTRLDPPLLKDASQNQANDDLITAFLEGGQSIHLAQAGGGGATAIGQVASISGKVFAVRGDGTRIELANNAQVFQNDVIETGAGASIKITFLDKSEFALGEGGRMALTQHIFDPASQTGKSVTSILKGAFVFTSGQIAATNKGDMTVNTPVAQIGIRGTKTIGDIRPEPGEKSTITILEGAIILLNGGGVVVLDSEGLTSQIENFETAPGRRFYITDEQAQQIYKAVIPIVRQLLPQLFDNNDPGSGDQGQNNPPGQGEVQLATVVVPLTQNLLQQGALANPQLNALDPLGILALIDPDRIINLEGGEGLGNLFTNVGGIIFVNVSLIDILTGGANLLDGGGSETTLDEVIESLFESTTTGGVAVAGTVNDDIITGTALGDALNGSDGNDTIDGGGGNDVITGGAGNDVLTGGAGNDAVSGGPGDDRLIAGTGEGNDIYDGNEGNDTIEYPSAINPLFIDMVNGITIGGAEIGVDTFINIENIIAGQGDDIIIVDGQNSTIDGQGGTDTVVFSGLSTDYGFETVGNIIEVTDNNIADGNDGVDTLSNVEILSFLDIDIPLIHVADSSGTEGGILTFTVTLGAATPGVVTVDYMIMDGTAESGNDYSGVLAGTLTFDPGETEQTVILTLDQDTLQENDETLSLTLSNVTGNALIGDTTANATISDDDAATTVSVSNATPTPQVEGSLLTFTISLSAIAGEDVTVDFTTIAGTAAATADYVAANGTATILANSLSTTVDVAIVGDAVDEPDEQFTLQISNAIFDAGGSNQALTITDNSGTGTITNAPSVSVTDAGSIFEGGVATFTISLSAIASKDVTIDFTTVAGTAMATADYVAVSNTATILAGSLSTSVNVTTASDAVDEPDEQFTLQISNAVFDAGGSNQSLAITDNSGAGTITNVPSVSVTDASPVFEGGVATFTISLSAIASKDVTIDFMTIAGTATATADYMTVSNTATILAGSLNTSVNVTTVSDVTNESDEQFSLQISNAVFDAGGINQGLIITDNSGTGTIINAPTLSIGDATAVIESDVTTFTISLSAITSEDVTVDFTTIAGTATATADYAAVSGTATILAGSLSTTVDVTTVGDTVDELDEQFTLQISNAFLDAGGINQGLIITDDSGTGTIINAPTLSIADAGALTEGDIATFTVTLSQVSTFDIKFDYTTVAGTASAGSDFTAVTSFATILAGQSSVDINVTTLSDAASELAEEFTVAISNAVVDPGVRNIATTITDASGTGTINDPPDIVSLSLGALTLSQGFSIVGENAGDKFGAAVSLTDINGDGLADMVFGASGVATASGQVYFVFGQTSFGAAPTLPGLADPNGFVLIGNNANSALGASLSITSGDINGDGLADMLSGSPNLQPSAAVEGGGAVLFGDDSGPISSVGTASLSGTNGFQISATPIIYGSNVGYDIDIVGDVNGDGLDDFVITSPYSQDSISVYDSFAFLVYGDTTFTASESIRNLDGTDGTQFRELAGDVGLGTTVAGGGDFNGDGFDDFLVTDKTGNAYLVYGSATSFGASFDITGITTTNGRIFTGIQVAGEQNPVAMLDFNGDGFMDIAIGSELAANYGRANAGAVYIVYGNDTGTLPLSTNLAANTDNSIGFTIVGAAVNDRLGYDIASAGDFNGDGFEDLIAVARYQDSGGINAGAAYIIFGSDTAFTNAKFDLNGLTGSAALRLEGTVTGLLANAQIAGAEDINGDGYDDVIIGLDNYSADTGKSYVIFGFDVGGAVTFQGTTGNDNLTGTVGSEVFIGDAGNDTISLEGGLDTVHAGIGDDTINYAPNASFFRLVDGGAGEDTLTIGGTGTQNIDFTSGDYNVQDIEVINLQTGTGTNTLTLNKNNVLDMSSTTNALRIDGDASDTVDISTDNFNLTGTTVINAITYDVYTDGQAIVQIQQGINVKAEIASLSLSGLALSQGFSVTGAGIGDRFGADVGLGDINGDGFADIIAGAHFTDVTPFESPTLVDSGTVYTLFGMGTFGAAPTLAGLSDPTGFMIEGDDAGANFGNSISSNAGDINGDGFADIIAGAYNRTPASNDTGGGYAFFGTSSPIGNTYSTSLSGTTGKDFFGYSHAYGTAAGISIAVIGDVDGDGFDDFLVGDSAVPSGLSPGDYNGNAYLVYGGSSLTDSINLAGLSANDGITLSHVTLNSGFGRTVANGGDGNGDDLADMFVSTTIGSAFVVFGQDDRDTSGISVTLLTSPSGREFTGLSTLNTIPLAMLDFNGDGIDDFVMGDPLTAPDGDTNRGSVYIVYGSTSGFPSSFDVSANTDGNLGVRIDGFAAGDLFGRDINSAGDFNGDGFEDLIVTAPFDDSAGTDFGAAYIIFGTDTTFAGGVWDLNTAYGAQVLRLEGIANGSLNTAQVAGGEDINGDGFDDIVIGRQSYNSFTGQIYTVFGYDVGDEAFFSGTTGNDVVIGVGADPAQIIIGGEGDDLLIGNSGADTLRGGAGNDMLRVSDLAFISIDGGTGDDTAEFFTAGQTIDFTMPGLRVTDIENISLGTMGNNHVILSKAAVVGLSPTTNTVDIDGIANDLVELRGNWSYSGIENILGTDFKIYQDGLARVRVEVDVPVAIPVLNVDTDDSSLFTRFTGNTGSANLGDAVAGGGDIDGDGLDDILISEPSFSTGYSTAVWGNSGTFGTTAGIGGASGAAFYKLSGRDPGEQNGTSLSFVGDLDGDGFADWASTAPYSDYSLTDRGAVYIVLGGTPRINIDISPADDLLGSASGDGFQVLGASAGDYLGHSVAGGDFNGDGFSDLLMGATGFSTNTGAAYLLFGKGSFNQFEDISTPDGTTVTRFDGVGVGDQIGFSVANAGDVNDDGIDDLLIGRPLADNGGTDRGTAYVVFGTTAGFGATVNLETLNGSDGFIIDGLDDNSYLGWSLNSAGDITGDGIADIVLGAKGADNGSAYVIFGKSTAFTATFDLTTLDGSNGFRIDAAESGDEAGISVASAGDFNGDGYDDIIIGAPNSTVDGNANTGSAFVIFGNASNTFASVIDLAQLDGTDGLRINGEKAGDYFGGSVSSAGDVNGDGFDDLIIGAKGVDYDSGTDQGAAYIIYGGDFTGEVDIIGTNDNDNITGSGFAEIIIGRAGPDIIDGKGGADTLYGGDGDDTIITSGSNFLRIDGGGGDDIWRPLGGFVASNLNYDKVRDIEIIDLVSGDGGSTFQVDSLFIQTANDGADSMIGTANTIRIDGDLNDTVDLELDGATAWDPTFDTTGYTTFTNDLTGAKALIQDGIVVNEI